MNLDEGPVIAFCRFFLDDEKTNNNFPRVEHRVTNLVNDKPNQKRCKAFSNRGDVFLHEMMHVELVVGTPKGLLCGMDVHFSTDVYS